MSDLKNKYKIKNHIKNFSKLIFILNNFFINKNFMKNSYLIELKNKIKNECMIEMSTKRLSNLLLSFHSNKQNFNKMNNIYKTINIEINKYGIMR